MSRRISEFRRRLRNAWTVLRGRELELAPQAGHAVLTVKRDMVEVIAFNDLNDKPAGTLLRYNTELHLSGLNIDLTMNLDQDGPAPDHPNYDPYHEHHQHWELEAGSRFILDITHHQVPGDTELLDWLSAQVEEACVTSCFELDGGVHLTIERPSLSGFAIRHANDLRQAIRQCMVKLPADDFGTLSIEPQPDPKV